MVKWKEKINVENTSQEHLRTVSPQGIRFNGQLYWHPSMSEHIGEVVKIRSIEDGGITISPECGQSQLVESLMGSDLTVDIECDQEADELPYEIYDSISTEHGKFNETIDPNELTEAVNKMMELLKPLNAPAVFPYNKTRFILWRLYCRLDQILR